MKINERCLKADLKCHESPWLAEVFGAQWSGTPCSGHGESPWAANHHPRGMLHWSWFASFSGCFLEMWAGKLHQVTSSYIKLHQVTSSYIKLQSLDSRRKTWRPHTLFACPIQESSWWALVTSIFQSALRKHVGIQLYKIILLSAEMECVWKCIPHPSVHHHFPSFLMVIFRVILFGPNFRQRCAKQTGLPQDAEAAVRRSRSGVAAVTGPHGGREGGSRISNDLWIRSLDPTFLVRFSSCFHVFSQDETVYFGFGDSADDWYRWWRWQVGRVRRGEFNDRTRAMGITGADARVIKWHWLPC